MACWIAVASADHVAIGAAQGFMQVNHGKAAPLRRMRPGDIVACYSPVQTYRTRTPLQAITAIGRVRDGAPYLGQMGGGFTPYRRDVDWFAADPAPIAPLLDRLALTSGGKTWGAPFRFGLVPVTRADMQIIAGAMGCDSLADAQLLSAARGQDQPTTARSPGRTSPN